MKLDTSAAVTAAVGSGEPVYGLLLNVVGSGAVSGSLRCRVRTRKRSPGWLLLTGRRHTPSVLQADISGLQ